MSKPIPDTRPATPPIVGDPTKIFARDLFKGKVLFCTGGGSGICKSITEAVMSLGARAVILGRQKERLESAAKELKAKTGQDCLPVQVDVRKIETLEGAVSRTIEKFGRIDFVICGAAGNFLAPIEGVSSNAFRTVIEIDTIGTYNTVKATLPYVRETRGSYLHISATLHYRGTPYQVHVSAAKAGVDALSRVLAVEEGPRGVRSNVIAPGAIADTEGFSRLSTTIEGDDNPFLDKMTPLQRVGRGMDIGNAAIWLFSDAASWVTGQCIAVDGGGENLRGLGLPYPQAVLDPASVRDRFKGKL